MDLSPQSFQYVDSEWEPSEASPILADRVVESEDDTGAASSRHSSGNAPAPAPSLPLPADGLSFSAVVDAAAAAQDLGPEHPPEGVRLDEASEGDPIGNDVVDSRSIVLSAAVREQLLQLSQAYEAEISRCMLEASEAAVEQQQYEAELRRLEAQLRERQGQGPACRAGAATDSR
eukprot:gnl/TRDRNA2_/TRDRNA2_44403_c0_seq2.p1 gnl/TRDRNA2_/TRDRNA2_44403_c0~~gnl/TRDRNA2_/TRDRNA2_44403_c0_seq2.p1  ORF type:complete len:175 (+),score=29.77 gnl/TRDRNA2_/TRDRNA2_44403_c0_seq2:51-575(+)